jgi:hypothetical protein
VRYHSGYLEENQPARFGQITFKDVFEYRFIDETIEYEEHDRHEHDGELGLVEITDSQYVETMLARSARAAGPAGRRLADHLPDSEIRHYRILFDDYGKLDVIAMGVDVAETSLNGVTHDRG